MRALRDGQITEHEYPECFVPETRRIRAQSKGITSGAGTIVIDRAPSSLHRVRWAPQTMRIILG